MKKKRKEKRFSMFSFLVLIFSILIIFFHGQFLEMSKDIFSFGKLSFNKLETVTFSTDINYKDDTISSISNKGIIISEKNKFKYFDIDGNEIWEKEINSNSPKIIMKKNYILVADMGLGEIFLLDYFGNIKSKINGIGSLKKIYLGDNDVIVAMLHNENVIILYDDKFEEINRIVIPQGEIIDFDISDKKSLMAVSLIKSDENNFYSNIIIYNLDGNMIGATNFESKYIYGISIVEDKIVGVLDNELVAINSDNEIIFSKNIDRKIADFFVDKLGNIVLNLEKDKLDITDTRENNVISIMSVNGETLLPEIPVVDEILEVKADEKFIVFAIENKIYFFDKKTGESLKIQDFEEEITNIFLMNNNLYLRHIDKINIYRIVD